MPLDQVILYFLKTEGLQEQELVSLVTPTDQAYAAQFHVQDRRVRALAGRALRRWCLKSAMGGVEPKINVGEHGKPFVEGGLTFVSSSTPGVVTTAVGWNREIGMDIESLDRLDQLGMTESELLDWTAREAVAKGTGRGLALALDGLVKEDSSIFVVVESGEKWSVQHPALPIRCVASVAFWGESEWELVTTEVRLIDLSPR